VIIKIPGDGKIAGRIMMRCGESVQLGRKVKYANIERRVWMRRASRGYAPRDSFATVQIQLHTTKNNEYGIAGRRMDLESPEQSLKQSAILLSIFLMKFQAEA
jgi:hypothetical protein